jgi:filamentous hemagglutinin
MDAKTIRFTQRSIKGTFTGGGSMKQLIGDLKSGQVKPDSIPPIRIFEKDGLIFTLDNRRLYVFQQAGVPIKTVPATPQEIAKEAWKFTTNNDGKSVRIRGGLK